MKKAEKILKILGCWKGPSLEAEMRIWEAFVKKKKKKQEVRRGSKTMRVKKVIKRYRVFEEYFVRLFSWQHFWQ